MYCDSEMNWAAASWYYAISLYQSNLSQPQSLQFICYYRVANYSVVEITNLFLQCIFVDCKHRCRFTGAMRKYFKSWA